jgi:hypothetical protein
VHAGRACRDRAEHDVGRRHREVTGVMLADAEEVSADLLGQDSLLDDVPDRLGMRERPVGLVMRDVAEGVEPKDEWLVHVPSSFWSG